MFVQQQTWRVGVMQPYLGHITLKARCNGGSLRAGKSSWQVDYRVNNRQQDGKVARFWTRGRAIRVSE
jgi:hypothetical protein